MILDIVIYYLAFAPLTDAHFAQGASQIHFENAFSCVPILYCCVKYFMQLDCHVVCIILRFTLSFQALFCKVLIQFLFCKS